MTACRLSPDGHYQHKLLSPGDVEPEKSTRWRALLALSSPPAQNYSSTESARGDEADQQETADADDCFLQQENVDLYVYR